MRLSPEIVSSLYSSNAVIICVYKNSLSRIVLAILRTSSDWIFTFLPEFLELLLFFLTEIFFSAFNFLLSPLLGINGSSSSFNSSSKGFKSMLKSSFCLLLKPSISRSFDSNNLSFLLRIAKGSKSF